LILNKEHKVVLFLPGFQTVQNPPGVKHDPFSLSLFLSPPSHPFSRPLRLFILLMLETSLTTSYSLFLSPLSPFPFFTHNLIAVRELQSRAVYWCYKFNFSSAHCPEEKGGTAEGVISRRENRFSIFRDCARDSS